jgi:glucose/arabinose dehydrogenase
MKLPNLSCPIQPARSVSTSVLEPLENRRLLAGDLPYVLDFTTEVAGFADRDGQQTGFEKVQPNSTFDEYQPQLIDLDTTAGVLNLTSRGNSQAGGNFGTDNTLANGLQTVFDASTGAFTVTATIKGPVGDFDAPNEQAGILYGPTQDNYVKLVLIARNNGTFIQFIDEQNTGNGIFNAAGSDGILVSLATANIASLDLILRGDPTTGAFTAAYRVNNGAVQNLPGQIVMENGQQASFFRPASRAGLLAIHKNDLGPLTVQIDSFSIERDVAPADRPRVTNVRPGNGSINAQRDGFIAADVELPNQGGVDASTLTPQTVQLIRVADNRLVPASVNTTGGGDAIVVTPQGVLDPDTEYQFVVTGGVRDLSGAAFVPFSSTFTTGTATTPTDTSVAFEPISLEAATGGREWSGLEFGPDGKLYASTLNGYLYRWTVQPDGQIGRREIIRSLLFQENGFTLITGFAFDPRSTPSEPIVWVTHSQARLENADDWTSKITRLSGANLEVATSMVIGLPRSARDHLINQPNFGPDGLLYIPHGGNNAFGAPDNAWANRPERELSASIYTLDIPAIEAFVDQTGGPLTARTEGIPNPYDPSAPGAPLTNFATGIRNAYDLLWHSNGALYAPINGSAAGGNTPAGPNGSPIGITNVSETQPDVLLRVQPGGYYGHPNPVRNEFVHSGGNPTAAADLYELTQYPVGTQPEANFSPPIYNFGLNLSPNGLIEYGGVGLNGALEGRIMVTRYSGGDDILVMRPNRSGGIASVQTKIPGLNNLADPVDLIENPLTGDLYVSELAAKKLTLLRPVVPAGNLGTPRVAYFNEPKGGATENRTFVPLTNFGDTPLVIPADGITVFNGTNQSRFDVAGAQLPLVIRSGETYQLPMSFNPASGATNDIVEAAMQIVSSDGSTPFKEIRLRGLPTDGSGGGGEPSLQRVFDVYDLAIDAGDSDVTTSRFDGNDSTGDQLPGVTKFRKSGTEPVVIQPISIFAPDVDRPARLGIYASGSPQTAQYVVSVRGGSDQTVSPVNDGPEATRVEPLTFGPQQTTNTFGLVGEFSSFIDNGLPRRVFSEASLNTWEANPNERVKMKVYPLKDSAGNVVPNEFVVSLEEAVSEIPADFQDTVFIVRNVEPVTGAGPEIGLETLDGSFASRLTMSIIPDSGLDPNFPNLFRDRDTVRVHNTGDQPLTINVAEPTGPFTVIGNPIRTINPGGFSDVTVEFVATDGRATTDVLTINTTDPDEPTVRLFLSGYFQPFSEQTPDGRSVEPSLQEIANALGYRTVVAFEGQDINTRGELIARGEEVLSAYWQRSDPDAPVVVTQIASYHMQGDDNTLRWFEPGTLASTDIVTVDGRYAQTLLPNGRGSSDVARAAFTPSVGTFGFRVENEWSDNTLNVQEDPSANGTFGHHMRFYPLRDPEGRVVADTYILAMDFQGINYDYNDNVYLIRNIRPAVERPAPEFAGGFWTGDDVRLNWQPTDNVDGYLIYRSDSFSGRYELLNGLGYTQSFFDDPTAVAGQRYVYAIFGINSRGLTEPVYTNVRT